jgi:hypothetical protein
MDGFPSTDDKLTRENKKSPRTLNARKGKNILLQYGRKVLETIDEMGELTTLYLVGDFS